MIRILLPQLQLFHKKKYRRAGDSLAYSPYEQEFLLCPRLLISRLSLG
jgi:hypothetical protein